jgi:plastocyanin
VTLNPAGGSYVSGTVVTLTATANSGYSFTGWSGDLTGSINPSTITVNSNKSCTATFAAIATYTLTASGTNGTFALNPAGGSYQSGTVVTLTATANSGYSFSAWSGDATGSTNPVTVTMSGNKTVTGTFTAIPTYTLTTSATNGTVTLNPAGGSYQSGTVVTLTATANSGYNFSSWSGDLTGSTNPSTITVNANKSVTANFSAASTCNTNNILSNCDFSNGSTGWIVGLSGATASFSGVADFNITSSSTDNWAVQLAKNGIPLTSGQGYTLTFDIKSDEGSRNINVDINAWSDGSWTRRGFDESVAVTTSWVTKTINFTANATDATCQLEFNLGQSATDVQIVNVKLVTSGNPPPPTCPTCIGGNADPVNRIVIINGNSYRVKALWGSCNTIETWAYEAASCQ